MPKTVRQRFEARFPRALDRTGATALTLTNAQGIRSYMKCYASGGQQDTDVGPGLTISTDVPVFLTTSTDVEKSQVINGDQARANETDYNIVEISHNGSGMCRLTCIEVA